MVKKIKCLEPWWKCGRSDCEWFNFFNNIQNKNKVDKKVAVSLEKLNKLGKKKLYVFEQNKICFSHRGYYFEYAPKTGLWRRVGWRLKGWCWVSNEADLISCVDSNVDYVEKCKFWFGKGWMG